MKGNVQLTDAHVGKFMIVGAFDRPIPVKIISVGDGMCGWAVLDPKMPLRSGKVRFDKQQLVGVYDTVEEVMEGVKA